MWQTNLTFPVVPFLPGRKTKKIFDAFENSSLKRQRVKTGTYDKLDEALLKWFKSMRGHSIPINGPIIVEKAHEFAKHSITMDRRKSVWNICGPYFNGKRSTEGKILLLDSNATVSDDEMIANIFNEYFCNITRDLPIQVLPCHAVDKAISRYANHPSILKIKDKCNGEQRQFEFSHVNETQVKRYILALDKNKGTSGAIKTSLLQASSSICSPYIVKLVNSAIDNSIFPSDLKKGCYHSSSQIRRPFRQV